MPQRFDFKALTGFCALGILLCFTFLRDAAVNDNTTAPQAATEQITEVPPVTYDDFGIAENTFLRETRPIQRNETFSDILAGYNIGASTIHTLAEVSKDVFDVRYLQAGKSLRVYQDASKTAQVLIYQPNPIDYVVFDLQDDNITVYAKKRPVTIERKTVSGTITSSPYEALVHAGADPALAVALSEVYAWQIDFYRIQRGDRFSIIYEEKQVEGQPVGLGDIIAARFVHAGEDFYAFGFEHQGTNSFFDENGESLQLAFLKAPLKYSRISSRYTKRRFHPVQRRYKPHLGTDYAAPTGTPIHATGDGVVLAASRTRGNGKYVKIRHNATYTTGYLHMSRFAEGIQPGKRVSQGDVIGYVGSTGLATGPHLCYRFWKDGIQVDPYKQDLPSADPIAGDDRAAFESTRDLLMPLLQDEAPSPVRIVALPSQIDLLLDTVPATSQS